MSRTWDPTSLTPEAALQRLINGNRRFRDESASSMARAWSSELAREQQSPFAIVLGCSDSRTPIEIIFDEGFGALFVVRIAGNIVAPSGVGSIEFAASQFGTRLVVVMGHTRCGAIGATIEAIQTGSGPSSTNQRAITDRIKPHIEPIVRTPDGLTPEQLARKAVRANVRASADHLRHSTAQLEELVMKGRIVIVGAEYELETGTVHFFDGVPGTTRELHA
jgi:carbonic anhydrase